jgi:hypothetical protein
MMEELGMSSLCFHVSIGALPPIAALALASCLALPAHAVEPNDDILGTWTLTKVLDSSEISSLDDVEAAQLVGKTLTIEPEKVSLGGHNCVRAPKFERHYEDTARYIREEAHAPAGRLGLPEVVTVVDLACTAAFLKNYNEIVIYWKGFFFDAVKQQPGGAEQSARRQAEVAPRIGTRSGPSGTISK